MYPDQHSRIGSASPRGARFSVRSGNASTQSQLSNLPTFKRSLVLSRDESPITATPLAATLTKLPVSVDSKELTQMATPLDATLTKNTGWGFPSPDIPTLRCVFCIPDALAGPSDVWTPRLSLFCLSLHQECFTIPLPPSGSTLFLKIAGCHPTIPRLELSVPATRGKNLSCLPRFNVQTLQRSDLQTFRRSNVLWFPRWTSSPWQAIISLRRHHPR
jgi:hypothetical protein